MRALFWAGMGVFMACVGIWACIDAPRASLLRFKELDDKIIISQKVSAKRTATVCSMIINMQRKIYDLEALNGHTTNKDNFDAVHNLGMCTSFVQF